MGALCLVAGGGNVTSVGFVAFSLQRGSHIHAKPNLEHSYIRHMRRLVHGGLVYQFSNGVQMACRSCRHGQIRLGSAGLATVLRTMNSFIRSVSRALPPFVGAFSSLAPTFLCRVRPTRWIRVPTQIWCVGLAYVQCQAVLGRARLAQATWATWPIWSPLVLYSCSSWLTGAPSPCKS